MNIIGLENRLIALEAESCKLRHKINDVEERAQALEIWIDEHAIQTEREHLRMYSAQVRLTKKIVDCKVELAQKSGESNSGL